MVKKTERRREKGAAVTGGTWTAEEDKKLVDYVKAHGDKQWRRLPANAGLNRCGKSCRLRWLNYLKPGIKRGNMSGDEEDLIIRLHNLLGNRWSLIAGRLPGRTDNEIKNYWNTHLSKRALTMDDLNRKFKHAPENGSFLPYPSAATETNDIGLCPTILNSNTDKDLEVEDYDLTGWDNNQDGFNIEFSYNDNDLDVEDYGLTSWDNNQDACNIEFCGSTEEGPLDIEALYDEPSEYDELIRFLEL